MTIPTFNADFAHQVIIVSKFAHLPALAHGCGTYGSKTSLRELSSPDLATMLDTRGGALK